MGAIDTVKEVLAIANKIGSIEIQQKLIDAQQQILDMQIEIEQLRENNMQLHLENKRLIDASELENRIKRHDVPIVTIIDDNDEIKYCASCWDRGKNLVQLSKMNIGSLLYACTEKDCKNRIMR
ncbi:MAG: hypothetical protein FWC20_04815 [Oscillospiraceae bacterium]|nr:hypothetical protein [Oscillospiraceae bacterium]MCL2278715.1 hypothetical protein [Oscillospiraceae bacterium]